MNGLEKFNTEFALAKSLIEFSRSDASGVTRESLVKARDIALEIFLKYSESHFGDGEPAYLFACHSGSLTPEQSRHCLILAAAAGWPDAVQSVEMSDDESLKRAVELQRRRNEWDGD